ncbi:hypothetical protein QL285_082378 [Trifolium repens]|nr:hypothetical protein QL285_082378 [Trifolium repens]
MAATLIVLAKLFATGLMPATCNNNFFAAKNTFCSNFAFLAVTFVAAKNDISCSAQHDGLLRLITKTINRAPIPHYYSFRNSRTFSTIKEVFRGALRA